MKRLILLITTSIICVFSLGYNYSSLLTQADFEFQRLDNSYGSAMSSALESKIQWESYNQWKCFKTTDLTIDCAVYDESTLVPSITVFTQAENFVFDVHAEDGLNCEETKYKWQNLINDGAETCIFAAALPYNDPSEEKAHSLWYIKQIKGINGYWEL